MAGDVATATVHGGFELHGEATPVRRLVLDLWRSRELLMLLARRDFFVRYRRPSFGVLWAVGLPLVQAAVLAVVFSQVVRIDAGTNYATFVLAGVLPWTFLSSALAGGATAISAGSAIATKVYFPRAILPLVAVVASFYGFVPTLGILLATAAVFGVGLWPHVLLLVPAVVVMVLLLSGFALVLSALHVYFRDVGFVVQAAMTPWFYGSAVIFPLSLVRNDVLLAAIEANPATGMIQLFRAAVVGPAVAPPGAVRWTLVWIVVLWTAALVLYRRFDRVFVDLL